VYIYIFPPLVNVKQEATFRESRSIGSCRIRYVFIHK